MAVVEWWGHLDIGAKYALGLSILISLVFIAGFIKLCVIRRRTKNYAAEAKSKATDEEGKLEQIALAHRDEGEGDLFGIRALERGYFGGVAQSRPTSPAPGSVASTFLPASNIPFANGRGESSTSTINIDVGGNSNPAGNGPQHGSRNLDVAVDMQLNVPESPKFPRSPERSRSPSPLSGGQSSPLIKPVTIPSPGLGLQYNNGGEGGVSPRMHAKSPMPVTTTTVPRGHTVFSDAASIISSDSPPNSPGYPPSHNQYNPYNPSIRIEEPDTPAAAVSTRPPRHLTGLGTAHSTGQNGSAGDLLNSNGNEHMSRTSTQSFADFYDSYYDGRRQSNNPPHPGTRVYISGNLSQPESPILPVDSGNAKGYSRVPHI